MPDRDFRGFFMELLRVVYHQYRWPFLAVMALTMASAGLGIGIIAFINQY
ncbi:hypothetical protein, partial [Klebsiella quasipneumoniae]